MCREGEFGYITQKKNKIFKKKKSLKFPSLQLGYCSTMGKQLTAREIPSPSVD